MDYIQSKLLKAIEKTKKRQSGKYSTIVGYYNVLIQYQLYLMFACVWDKREPELSRSKKIEYLKVMKRATLGTILSVIMELDSCGEPILHVNKIFQQQILEFIKPRNTETAHGILIPGVQEESYQELAESYEKIFKAIQGLRIPILSQDCRIYYMSDEKNLQVTVFENDDYDYEDLSEEVVKALDMHSQELYYYFDDVCYKISPFLLVREIPSGENPYEIYCYQEYNLKNGKFEYKRYSDLSENISYSEVFKEYFLSFQEELSHTITKVNGVICNKFENNYDYFIATSPIDTHVQKIWEFIKKNKSNACLTIRGGGGIGKTALVQYICTKNIFEPILYDLDEIQYVVFCSAKDREFKQTAGLMGHIRSIKDESIIRCYEDVLRTISWVLDLNYDITTEDGRKNVEEALSKTAGVLIIIDDFETLSEVDKKKIVALSSKLDVSKHKMLITTRSQYMVGEEYYIENLDREQTIAFMKERFKQSCSEKKYKEFELFSKEKKIKNQILELTDGLPMLALQLGNILVFNGCKESSLNRKENEEIEEFLLGRLYSYFGTKTSKVLFLIIANFFQYNNEEIGLEDLKTIYFLFCERMHLANVDFEQDVMELKKLNIIKVESDFIRISNYISSKTLRKCQKDLQESGEIQNEWLDQVFFKTLSENGIKDGLLLYVELENAKIDYAFIKIFAFEKIVKYTEEIRFSLIEKYLKTILHDINEIQTLFMEACKYFEISDVEIKFAGYGKKYGFILPELKYRRDILIEEEEISVDYYLEELIKEFTDVLDLIDEFVIERKQGASQSYCLEKMQSIRGTLGSICNVKLAKVLSLDLSNDTDKLEQVCELIEDISFTKEFTLKENDQYKRLLELLH